MSEPEQRTDELRRQLRDCVARGLTLNGPLDALLAATCARATGLWSVENGCLRLLGFRGVNDIPAAVKAEFAAAIREVSLDQSGLGIVKAAVSDAPALASRDRVAGGLNDSASWLERFEAMQSLAIPIRHEDRVVGVLAISTADRLWPHHPSRELLAELAASLGDALV